MGEIETILMKHDKKYIKHLQKEIERLEVEKEQLNSLVNSCQEEIRKLKELCNKYEEEHSTKFNEWVFDKRENERLTQGVTLLTNKLIDMTKEKERLKAREQECIDKYLSMSKFANEMESKYIIEKYIVDELEKWLEEDLKQQYRDCGHRNNIIREVYNKLKELKEIRPKEESK